MAKVNCEDCREMLVSGYKKSRLKSFLTWTGIFLSGGILLLLLSWRKRSWLSFTHSECPLEEAEKVLIKDSYKQIYVETVYQKKDASQPQNTHRYFYNKKIKYIWSNEGRSFMKIDGLKVSKCNELHLMNAGLTRNEAEFRLQYFEKNSLVIKLDPILKLVFREVKSPVYLWQEFIVGIFFGQQYYNFAICVILLTIISITATVWETRKQSRTLRDSVRTETTVTVLRDQEEVQKSSQELVPGDVIVLPQSDFTMACDAVLLNGSCIVNESMLTGESTPVTKVPLPNDAELVFNIKTHRLNMLFCGTHVLYSQSPRNSKIKAVVYRTGFCTARGELVRSILFPKPVTYKLHSDLFKYLIISLIVGIIPFTYTIIVWKNFKASTEDIALIVFTVISFVLPPLLPAVFTSINALAQRRLRKSNIYCLDSKYINFAGGLDTVCFDKTGTLTEDDLDFSGALCSQSGKFQKFVKDAKNLPNITLQKAMAVCHTLTNIKGKLLGYTLDVKMFEVSGWEIKEIPVQGSTKFERNLLRIVSPLPSSSYSQTLSDIAIIRQFPFESSIRRMCVVAKSEDSECLEVYVKGSPKMISSLCLRETVPPDINDVLEHYGKQGLRILAVGHKILPPELSWDEVLSLKRENLEGSLHFQGFIIFENRLKPETVPTITVLKNASIKTVMVTGDNLLTAITVAKESGMIEQNDTVISVEAKFIDYAKTDFPLVITYTPIQGSQVFEKPNLNIDNTKVSTNKKWHIVLDGESFELIRRHDQQLLYKIVHKGTVFAAMLPEQKLHLVEMLQDLGHEVGMCGDGANDCCALKTAHVGISLSLEEASVAAPFTSIQQNISCVPTLIREGRATLTSTFCAFKYMVCYSYVFLMAYLTLSWDGQILIDGTFVLIDIVLNLCPQFLFGFTGAHTGLVKRLPPRRIISFLTLFSVYSFIIIQMGFHIFSYDFCMMQSWYEPFVYNATSTFHSPPTYVGTTIISINSATYLIAAVIFSIGPPYRKRFFSNKFFTVVLVLEFLLVSWLIIHPPDFISNFINIKRAPSIGYHLMLYAICAVNFAFCYVWEVLCIQNILVKRVSPAIQKFRGPVKKYEEIEEELTAENNWPPVESHDICDQWKTHL